MDYREYAEIAGNECLCGLHVIKLETHELFYLNEYAIKNSVNPNNKNYFKEKCYSYLYGLRKPCAFCPISKFDKENSFTYSNYNPQHKKHYSINTKKIIINNEAYKLDMLHDTTELAQIMQEDKALLACVEVLHTSQTPDKAINEFLKVLAGVYKSERSFLLEFSEDFSSIKSSYGYAAKGSRFIIDGLLDTPFEIILDRLDRFSTDNVINVKSITSEEYMPEDHAAFFQESGIDSLIVSPIKNVYDEIIALVGVVNSSSDFFKLSIIESIAKFLSEFLEKKAILTKLSRLSYRDGLTGLANRQAYTETINNYGKKPPLNLGLLHVDINGLKHINATYNTDKGDETLILLAKILSSIFEKNIYRVGDDEFIVLCENTTKEIFDLEIQEVKNKILEVDELDVSIGFLWNSNCVNIMKQIEQVDSLMYIDKLNYYHTNDGSPTSRYRTMLANTLISELAEGKFTIYLQPQFDLKTGLLDSAEALVRRFDKNGFIEAPFKFIPLYEKEGIIQYLDFYVFEFICKMLQRWNDKGITDFRVAVNFSRHTLEQEDIVSTLCSICNKYGVQYKNLTIEITETIQTINEAHLTKILKGFNSHGFSVALDDFGAGYSNLSMLIKASFTELKIDKKVVDSIVENEKARVMTKYSLSLCDDLSIETSVAEGVETKEQAEVLKDLNCVKGQGFYFARPMPIEKFEEIYFADFN